DVGVEPAPCLGIRHGSGPAWDALLFERLVTRDGVDEPADAEGVLVVDGHPPLEVAGVETVGPEADASYGPWLIRLGGIRANPSVDEAMVEFVEAEPGMSGGPWPILATQGLRPVRVEPFEVHRVDRVLLTLEPVTGNV